MCHEGESLSAMLLDLPIITQDTEPTSLLVTSQSEPSTSVKVTVESLVEENFMIIEHEPDLVDEQTHSKDDAVQLNDERILWGCKQCDFRFVK